MAKRGLPSSYASDRLDDAWAAAQERESRKRREREQASSPGDVLFAACTAHGTAEAHAAAAAAEMERAQEAIVAPRPRDRGVARLDGLDFETWCKTGGLDRDFVRRNYAVVRRRFEEGGTMLGIDPPRPPRMALDRYAELGD